jgi:branched-subunit amino acid ABC-type transport system permease component
VSEFVQFLYSALVLASIFSAMAMGLSLVWGGLRMLNMAHGGLIMLGAYTAYFASADLGLHPLLGLVLAIVTVAAVAALLYPLVVRPLIGRQGWDINVIIATVALALLFSQIVLLLFGPKAKSLPKIADGGFDGPAGLFLSYQTLIMAAVSLLSLAALALFLSRMRYGVALRAVAQNLEGAQLLGLPVGRVYVTTLALSGALAALSGVLLASGFLFIEPTMGLDPMLKSLVIVVLGGLGSIKGTLYAAVAAGLVNSGVSTYVGPEWSLPALFAVVIAVLLLRPTGFFGTSERLA